MSAGTAHAEGRARRLAREEGLTLIEVLIAGIVGLVLFGTILTLLTIFLRGASTGSARAEAVDQARGSLERMTRELRQATSVTAVGGGAVEFSVWVRTDPGDPAGAATLRAIRYDCTAPGSLPNTRMCTRVDGTAGGAATRLIDAVSNTDVFSLRPSDRAIQIRLDVPVQGGRNSLSLADSVAPRNCDQGPGVLNPCEGG